MIRSVVRPENLTVSSGQVYMGYGGSTDFSLANAATRLTAAGGNIVSGIALFPAFDAMRQALTMVQGFVIMVIIICLPIVTVMSSYDLKAVATLSFVLFGIYALSFWWELARWLDTWMFEALYSSDTHSRWNMMGLQNATDDLVLEVVAGTMFLLLPTVWMGAMGWAGVKTGAALASIAGKGSQDAQKAGSKGGEMAQNAIQSKVNSNINWHSRQKCW